MGVSRGLLAHQHKLALLVGKPRLKDGLLVFSRAGNTQQGSLAIKPVSLDGIGAAANPVEPAPRKGLDRTRLLGLGLFLDGSDIRRGGFLGDDPADGLRDRRRRRLRWRQGTQRLFSILACGIRSRQAAIGTAQIVELRLRHLDGEKSLNQGSQNQSKRKIRESIRAHRRHHSAASLARLLAFGATLMLAACGEYDSLRAGKPLDQIDWNAKADEYSQPGPLGIFFNRKPPPVWIRASGPYPGPLSEPVPPLITAEIADLVVAAPLRAALTQEARMNLATASMLAASAATGTAVSWKAEDADGHVTPARDVYRSHRGHVCRDLQQQIQKLDQPQVEQVTLCREDLGDNRILWLPGSPD